MFYIGSAISLKLCWEGNGIARTGARIQRKGFCACLVSFMPSMKWSSVFPQNMAAWSAGSPFFLSSSSLSPGPKSFWKRALFCIESDLVSFWAKLSRRLIALKARFLIGSSIRTWATKSPFIANIDLQTRMGFNLGTDLQRGIHAMSGEQGSRSEVCQQYLVRCRIFRQANYSTWWAMQTGLSGSDSDKVAEWTGTVLCKTKPYWEVICAQQASTLHTGSSGLLPGMVPLAEWSLDLGELPFLAGVSRHHCSSWSSEPWQPHGPGCEVKQPPESGLPRPPYSTYKYI